MYQALTQKCTYYDNLPHKEKETSNQCRISLSKALRRLGIPAISNMTINYQPNTDPKIKIHIGC